MNDYFIKIKCQITPFDILKWKISKNPQAKEKKEDEFTLKAFDDLNGKTFIPMHYATYDLADEPLGEPVRVLKENNTKYNIKILDIGEQLKIIN